MARLGAIGSDEVADGIVSLMAWDLPPWTEAQLLTSLTRDFVPFAAGSQGGYEQIHGRRLDHLPLSPQGLEVPTGESPGR